MKKIGFVKYLPNIAAVLVGGYITVSILDPDLKLEMPKDINFDKVTTTFDNIGNYCSDKYNDITEYFKGIGKKNTTTSLNTIVQDTIVEPKEEIKDEVVSEEETQEVKEIEEVEVIYDEYTDTYLLDHGYEFKDIDVDAYNAENSDYVGYIDIPGTRVQYPVYCGDDNEEYLHTNAQGKKDSAGEIYLDTRVDTTLGDDTSTIQSTTIPIFGHNMGEWRDRKMFHDIRNFNNQSYVDKHPYGVYYNEDGDVYALQVVAAFNDATGYDTNIMVYNLDYEQCFNEYMEFINEHTLINTDVSLEYGDKIVNIVTCSYGADNERLIVVCKAVKQYTNEEINKESENVKKLTK